MAAPPVAGGAADAPPVAVACWPIPFVRSTEAGAGTSDCLDLLQGNRTDNPNGADDLCVWPPDVAGRWLHHSARPVSRLPEVDSVELGSEG